MPMVQVIDLLIGQVVEQNFFFWSIFWVFSHLMVQVVDFHHCEFDDNVLFLKLSLLV